MSLQQKDKIELSTPCISAVIGMEGVLSLTDKRSGHCWSAGEAMFLLEVYDLCNDRRSVFELSEDDFATENCSNEELCLRVMHVESGISFKADFSVKEEELTLRIPIDGILEAKNKQFLLKSIEFNPLGFSARTGEEGYLLLPNYSGVICRFTREKPQQYRNLFYLKQSQWEDCAVLPLFGMVSSGSAFLAVVRSGEFDTEVVTSLHWGEEHLNSIHPCFHYRYDKPDQIDKVDRVISYFFLAGEEADYVGMAGRYRHYLVHDKGVLPLRKKVALSPEAAYVYDAYSFIKIFCAVKEEQPDGSIQYRVATTFDEAIRIMERFKEEGIEKARFILVGWNWDGHDGRYPSRFPVDQRIGGEEGLRKLAEAAERLGYQITFHDNYSDSYQDAPDWDESDVIKDRDGQAFKGGVWLGRQSYFVCPYRALWKHEYRDLPKIKQLGLKGWYYIDGTPRALRGCYDPSHGHPLTRRAEGEGIMEQARLARAYFGGCAVEMPTAFMILEVDEVAHIPCLGIWPSVAASELVSLIDEVVPFFHIAIHGLVIYHIMDWKVFPRLFGSVINGILKEIEWGALPRTEMTFKDYEEHLPWMKMEYESICRELGYLQLEFIEKHGRIAPDIYETVFSDGTSVVVNYGEDDYFLEGNTVKAKWYLRIPAVARRDDDE